MLTTDVIGEAIARVPFCWPSSFQRQGMTCAAPCVGACREGVCGNLRWVRTSGGTFDARNHHALDASELGQASTDPSMDGVMEGHGTGTGSNKEAIGGWQVTTCHFKSTVVSARRPVGTKHRSPCHGAKTRRVASCTNWMV